jgi:predicted GNAT family N-acyltransferase
MAKLEIQIIAYAEAEPEIQHIRTVVFQHEQQVARELEFDGQDATATHLIAYLDGSPVGTARIRYLSDSLAKIERVAVLSECRGMGIGKQIMKQAIAHIHQQGIPEIKINSQTRARLFYEKFGFLQQGDEFEEANIPHIEMRLNLAPKLTKC